MMGDSGMETVFVVQFKNTLTDNRWMEYSRHDRLDEAKRVMEGGWTTPHRLIRMTSAVLYERDADVPWFGGKERE